MYNFMRLSMCDKTDLTDLDSLSSQSSNFVLYLLLVTVSPPDAIDVSGVNSTPLGMLLLKWNSISYIQKQLHVCN